MSEINLVPIIFHGTKDINLAATIECMEQLHWYSSWLVGSLEVL